MPDEEAQPSSSLHEDGPTEQTPLLPADAERSQPQRDVSAHHHSLTSLGGNGKSAPRRWPSLLALLALCIVVVLIIVFAFLAPSAVEQYAQAAIVFTPTALSIDSLTPTGVRARVQGDFRMDASRVERKAVRDLGRFFTYIAHEAESGESEVEVSLPEYGNVLLGTAHVPGVKVDLRNGHTTHVDVLSDLEPGDVDGIRRIANDWIEGRLGQLRVLGKASVPVRSGIVSLGRQTVTQEMLFANKDIPGLPAYNIKSLNVRDISLPSGGTGMAADVSLAVENPYPVDFNAPPLAFNILVPGCTAKDPSIKLANAETAPLHIHPHQPVIVNATGVVHHLSDLLTQDCPGSHVSPLDSILRRYMNGENNTVYVRGSSSSNQHLDTPKWITDLISDITVPVPLPGKELGHLIRNFSLTDTHFTLPEPFVRPGSKEANPTISANVRAVVALPEEMNFNLSVSRVRADADIFYHGKKLGILDLHKWQAAQSTRVVDEDDDAGAQLLEVQSAVKDAPIEITDDDVFTEVLQALLFGGRTVLMQIKADVDVAVTSALGELIVRRIPAEGQVPIQPISPGGGGGDHTSPRIPHEFRPKVFGLQILDTAPTSLTLGARVNMTNPTPYSANVPYLDIHILVNDSIVGHATAENIKVGPGENTNLDVQAVWDPYTLGGEAARKVGVEFLSQYISGYNTSLTLRMHEHSIPANPVLSRALSRFNVTMPTPSLGSPRQHIPSDPHHGHDPDDDPPDDPWDNDRKSTLHYLEDATFHLLTSTATFTLLSPLTAATVHITRINATAFYPANSSEPENEIGHIDYGTAFAVPPINDEGQGVQSPRLPVEWSLGGVGYEAVKGALGGTLRVGAYAEVGVRIGRWAEGVWYRAPGVGAKVRL
ncbi:hypothetical protein LTR53_002471 [Teratosphaeriaceae sp. CCFEE 6253]|nr:hypothetical protein LTR53_002471 [Teratosphaeriaceae sp. CCFEE 6253]